MYSLGIKTNQIYKISKFKNVTYDAKGALHDIKLQISYRPCPPDIFGTKVLTFKIFKIYYGKLNDSIFLF